MTGLINFVRILLELVAAVSWDPVKLGLWYQSVRNNK